MKGYCANCKTQEDIEDAERIRLRNLQLAYRGKCKTCGTEIYKTIKEQ